MFIIQFSNASASRTGANISPRLTFDPNHSSKVSKVNNTEQNERAATKDMRWVSHLQKEQILARFAVVTILALMLGVPAIAQSCNPAIDGTYCATQLPRSNSSARSSVSFDPIQSPMQGLGGDLSIGQDQPGTLGAITFRGGGTVCIGLLNRGNCN